MSSNSPVLLLAPSAVPTAPIMTPLLVAKSADLRARGLMPNQASYQSMEVSVASTNVTPVTKAASAPPTAADTAPPPPASSSTAAAVATDPKPSSPVITAAPTTAAVVVPPISQVANAAPIVSPRPSAAIPTTPAAPPAAAMTSSPARPSVAAPTTRAAALASSTTTHLPKRNASSPTTTTPTTTTLTVATSAASSSTSPASSPKAAPSSSPSSPSSPTSPKVVKSSTGRWTEAEHKLFLKGLEQFPYRAWKKIATLIKTRTVVQIRTHAQKYYQKLEKEEQRMREREAQLAAQQQQQQQQQGLASAAASASASTPSASTPSVTAALSSAVSTPRSAVPSAPTTPAAAASASFRELSLASPLLTTPLTTTGAAACSHAGAAAVREDADTTLGGGALGKRKAPLRKRKSSADELSDAPSSLPKRMMKEKKFVRDKTMSPKQKTVVSNGRAFGFGGDADASSSGDDCGAKGASVRGLGSFKTHPLDFDDDDDVAAGVVGSATSSATAMLLDFAEEKPMEYPFALDTALERGLAAIDHDELLQLSDDDDDGMEWFASAAAAAAAGEDVELLDGTAAPLYSEDALHFVDPAPAASQCPSQCPTPSPVLSSAADCSDFGLSSDEVDDDDDDFVLDPEKFLSSYFNPGADGDARDAAAL